VLNASNTSPPESSTGGSGDKAGDIAVDGTHLYYCTADHTDGLTAIWVRLPWQSW
jgi:hypothetical protein